MIKLWSSYVFFFSRLTYVKIMSLKFVNFTIKNVSLHKYHICFPLIKFTSDFFKMKTISWNSQNTHRNIYNFWHFRNVFSSFRFLSKYFFVYIRIFLMSSVLELFFFWNCSVLYFIYFKFFVFNFSGYSVFNYLYLKYF